MNFVSIHVPESRKTALFEVTTVVVPIILKKSYFWKKCFYDSKSENLQNQEFFYFSRHFWAMRRGHRAHRQVIQDRLEKSDHIDR